MCKFIYLGYEQCDEPERHYLIRREKCGAKAHLKHWCGPHEQEEDAMAEKEGRFWVSLPCPMCAEVPVVYDQPLLEIAHSRRSVLPAPHYDAVAGKYSRLPKHHNHNYVYHHHAAAEESSASLIPKPLNPVRAQVARAASENAVNRILYEEMSPDYMLPAATYEPPARQVKIPKPLPVPQPITLTPPSSREGSVSPPQHRRNASASPPQHRRQGSVSPPQNRAGEAVRMIPPGESSRNELTSIRERAIAAAAVAAKESRPGTPQSQAGADRSRSGSASSSSSSTISQNTQPPVSHRKQSIASSASAGSSPGSTSSRSGQPSRYQRKDSETRGQPQQDSLADNLAVVALRSIGIARTASPERGRRPQRREHGGSSRERSDSPLIWRPTISPPTLQQDSLGIGSLEEPHKQRLVPFPSRREEGASTIPNGASMAQGEGLAKDPQPRPKTPHPVAKTTTALSLFPNGVEDEKVAQAAFQHMFAAETRAACYGEAMSKDDAREAIAELSSSGGDPYSTAGVGGISSKELDKALPTRPSALKRIKTGQVKTVNIITPPRPMRAHTTDNLSSSPPKQQQRHANVKVRAGPLFSFAGVSGAKKQQEFEIVTGPDGSLLRDPEFGDAF